VRYDGVETERRRAPVGFNIAFVLFPDFEEPDFAGPYAEVEPLEVNA
jgi:hypothetical protein